MSISPVVLNLDFAEIEIYPNYIISKIQEGIIFSVEHLEILNTVFQEYYPNKRFGYVSNRINDYSVDPICYLDSKRFINLSCIAVWYHNETTLNTTKIEKSFNSNPFEAFETLDECVSWIEKILSEE